MNRRPAEVVPAALPIDDALRGSAPLSRLRERLDESRGRFRSIQDALPGAWAGQVQPGPVDDAGWTLLAANPAVAAKLRQMLPALERQLGAAGWPARVLRVRVVQSAR